MESKKQKSPSQSTLDKFSKFIQDGDYFEIGNYYARKKKIGMGSFATIFHAIDKDLGREVAIKRMNVPDVKKLSENVIREMEIMKNLRHQNIIKLYDVIYEKDYETVNIVMEYASQGNLSEFLKKKGSINEKYTKHYMIQIADGLKYLFKHKIVHRDLKPQNILLFEGHIVKLADFGFARNFEQNQLFNTFCGSPIYMAPEMIIPSSRRDKSYGIKSDLWSIGMILYEMITGTIPLNPKNMQQIPIQLKTLKIELPYEFKVSHECRDLLNRLLVKDPDLRIEWKDFFNHPWLKVDEVIEDENKIIEKAEQMIINPSSYPVTSFNHSNNSNTNTNPRDKLASSMNLLNFDLSRKPKHKIGSKTSSSSSSRSNSQLDQLHNSLLGLQQSLYKKPGQDLDSTSSSISNTGSIKTIIENEDETELDEEVFYSCEYKEPLETVLNRTNKHEIVSEYSTPIEKSQIHNLLDQDLNKKLDNIMEQLHDVWEKKRALSKLESKVSDSIRSQQGEYDPNLSFNKMFGDSTDDEYQVVDLSFHEDHFQHNSNVDIENGQEIYQEEKDKYVVISTNPVNITRSDITQNRAINRNSFKYYLNGSINILKESITYLAGNSNSL